MALLRPIQRCLPILNPLHSRPYIAVNDNLLRIINNELTHLTEYRPPLQPPSYFRSFTIDDRLGEQWVRLKSVNPSKNEEVKIDATMFDGVAPIPEAKKAIYEGEVRLHVSLVVEVTKADESGSDSVMVFICSAWPESIEVQKVFPLGKRTARVQPYMAQYFY